MIISYKNDLGFMQFLEKEPVREKASEAVKCMWFVVWNAAKEDSESKETCWVVEPYENDYVCFPHWHVTGKDGLLFEGPSKERCIEWAIENGYRVEDN